MEITGCSFGLTTLTKFIEENLIGTTKFGPFCCKQGTPSLMLDIYARYKQVHRELSCQEQPGSHASSNADYGEA
jgi:hypothetical protein